MRLIVQTGIEAGREFRLTKSVTTIGRDPGNDITLSDDQTSRRHAEIQRRDNELLVTDLGSTNGTFINEVRITAPHVLRHGDSVRVGNTTLSFQMTREEVVPEAVWGPPVRQAVSPLPIILIAGAVFLVMIIVVFAPVPIIPRPGPTPTPIMTSTATPLHTPTPTLFITSTPAPTRTPTLTPSAIATATPTPTSPCPNPGVRITTPTMGDRLTGAVSIKGSATIDDFDFYKLEYGSGEFPTPWHMIGDLHYTSVSEGHLGTWNTDVLPEGVYILRFTVVDKTGNYPPPCETKVTIER